MKFTKMQGAGNDYIYINCFAETVPDPAACAVKVSDRHFGVGADGLVLICPSDIADVKMRMFNADGSEGMMCGNAARCVAAYAYDNGLAKSASVRLETRAGIKTVELVRKDGKVTGARVDMGAPTLDAPRIPCAFAGETTVVDAPLRLADGKIFRVACVGMGNPHCVTVLETDPNDFALEKYGPLVERHENFPDRVNAEFVRVFSAHHLQMRVWERGSGETLACGTGACAAVVACVLRGLCAKDTDVRVSLKGGDLLIRWDSARDTVFKTGPTGYICTGTLLI